MSDENNPFSEFMSDYFAEADEHLTIIRNRLVAVENSLQRHEPPDMESMEELLRCFHTLKGLSGMVGLKPAEDLAHRMETCVKQLSEGIVPLDQAVLATLVQATGMMETVLVACRNKKPFPSMETVIDNLENRFLNGSNANGKRDDLPESAKPTKVKQPSSPPSDNPVWRFVFSPGQALSERGIDVNRIRERLEKVGILLQVSPQVNTDGKVFFEFLVATAQDKETFAPWKHDGVSYELLKNAASVPRSPVRKPHSEKEASESESFSGVSPSNMVRVNLERLDDLMQRVGDLVISRSRMENRIGQLEKIVPASAFNSLLEVQTAMERQLRDLREGIMRLRLVPMGDIFNRMRFLVRDLASKTGKKVGLHIIGKETEIDKYLVERMMDPLLHLVRNAIAHGLETEAERLEKGKDPQGNITLSAATEGDAVIIEITDDGRGVRPESLEKRAKELGLSEDLSRAGQEDLLRLICKPGFSTRREADMESGRGVGMTVVAQAVQELGGRITFRSVPDKGCSFRIHLPLTLAIVDAFIVKVGSQTFAVPQPSVREVIDFRDRKLAEMQQNELLSYRGGAIPLIRLSRIFGMAENHSKAALVVGNGLDTACVAVDRVLTKQEIVVRTLDDPLVAIPGIAGATELGDGRAVMILDLAALITGHSSVSGSQFPVRED